MISGIGSSLAGLFAFGSKLSAAAHNVANVNTDGYRKTTATIAEGEKGLPVVAYGKPNVPPQVIREPDGITGERSNVELSEEFTRMMISLRGYEANIKTLKTEDEMIGTLIDIIG